MHYFTTSAMGKIPSVSLLALMAITSHGWAQHSDVEFSYRHGVIEFEFGAEGPVFEGDFPTSGPLDGFTNEPGFASETAEGMGINPDDRISYHVLGPLLYHDGLDFSPTSATVTGDDQPNAGSVVISSATTVGDDLGGLIGQANGTGDLHADLGWLLSVPAATGAYGVPIALETDEPGIVDSDPFYLVFNYGLNEETFEGAVAEFASMIPEPATPAVAAAAGCLALTRWRRQRG